MNVRRSSGLGSYALSASLCAGVTEKPPDPEGTVDQSLEEHKKELPCKFYFSFSLPLTLTLRVALAMRGH